MTQEYEEILQDMKRTEQLRKSYEHACNDYLIELLKMWELDGYYGYWIGDEVGGIYDYDGGITISMEDIIYCVEHNVTKEQYWEWQEYCVEANEFGFSIPNLKSWMMGCPRTPQGVFDRLRQMKQQLNELIGEEKQRQEKGKHNVQ